MPDNPLPLTVPNVDSVRYERNFIKTAVCEIRFPTLLELETKRPTDFQKAIRKDYPHYEQQVYENTGNEEQLRQIRHLFYSKNRTWIVTLKSSALALETSKYTEFSDFKQRMEKLVNISRDLIDSDYFTRVGLRYINSIPIEDGDIKGWLNQNITSDINQGVFGEPSKYASVIQGYTDVGNYTLRQGFDLDKTPNNVLEYQLDFDYFNESVEYKDVISLIDKFNKINFNFFSWCLGEKAISWLGKGRKKKG